MGAEQQPPQPVVVSKPVLAEGEHTYDYTIVIEGVGDHGEAERAAELGAQTLYDAGHHIKAAHITTHTNGPKNIRVLRY